MFAILGTIVKVTKRLNFSIIPETSIEMREFKRSNKLNTKHKWRHNMQFQYLDVFSVYEKYWLQAAGKTKWKIICLSKLFLGEPIKSVKKRMDVEHCFSFDYSGC